MLLWDAKILKRNIEFIYLLLGCITYVYLMFYYIQYFEIFMRVIVQLVNNAFLNTEVM